MCFMTGRTKHYKWGNMGHGQWGWIETKPPRRRRSRRSKHRYRRMIALLCTLPSLLRPASVSA